MKVLNLFKQKLKHVIINGMVYLVILFTSIAVISGIYLHNKTKKTDEYIYEEMVSLKGWVLLTTLIVGFIIYLLQKMGILWMVTLNLIVSALDVF